MLIVFSGTDGAGKSSQVQLLKHWCYKQGMKSGHLWARGGYTPSFNALKRLARLFSGNRLPKAGNSSERLQALSKPGVSYLWLSIAIIDLIIYWGIYLRIMCLFCRVVICDRYIDDTRLDFRRNFPCISFERMVLWRMLERCTPNPDAAFLLLVPVDETIRRSRQKCEPFPDDAPTLEWRLQSYMSISRFPLARYSCLDCRRSVTDVSEEIVCAVSRIMGLG